MILKTYSWEGPLPEKISEEKVEVTIQHMKDEQREFDLYLIPGSVERVGFDMTAFTMIKGKYRLVVGLLKKGVIFPDNNKNMGRTGDGEALVGWEFIPEP